MQQYPAILKVTTATLSPHFGKASQAFFVDERADRYDARQQIAQYVVDHWRAYDIETYIQDPLDNWTPKGRVRVIAYFRVPGTRLVKNL